MTSLQQGDNSTKFFYKITNSKSKINNIEKLWVNGQWIEDQRNLVNHIVGYYQDLFKEPFGFWPKLNGLIFNKMLREKQEWPE